MNNDDCMLAYTGSAPIEMVWLAVGLVVLGGLTVLLGRSHRRSIGRSLMLVLLVGAMVTLLAPDPTAFAAGSESCDDAKPSPSASATVSPTETATATPTSTATATATATATGSPTSTATVAPTATPTATVAPTSTATVAPTSTATVTPTSTATVTPTSTVTPTATAPPTGTATATPTVTVTPTPTVTPVAIDLSLASTVSTSLPMLGELFGHTLTVTNVTTTDSTAGVRVFLPAVLGITGTYQGTDWSLVDADLSGSTYQYSGVIAAGASAPPLAADLTGGLVGSVTLTAQIETGSGGDTVVGNNSISEVLTVVAMADLAVSVLPLKPALSVFDQVDVRYTVSNSGLGATDGSLITVTIPKTDADPNAVYSYDPGSLPTGWTLLENPAAFVFTNNNAMAAGASAEFVIRHYHEVAIPVGEVFNYSITVSGGGGDADAGNNSALATIPFIPFLIP